MQTSVNGVTVLLGRTSVQWRCSRSSRTAMYHAQHWEFGHSLKGFATCAVPDPGMKVLLSLADNWKYAGGVDQYVDWSSTVPERGVSHTRPPDVEGDTDTT